MKYWEEMIYRSIESMGGEADLQEIYQKLPDIIALTEKELGATRWGGRPAYYHTVRSYCYASIEVGHLASAENVTTPPENKAVKLNQEGVKLWREDVATD